MAARVTLERKVMIKRDGESINIIDIPGEVFKEISREDAPMDDSRGILKITKEIGEFNKSQEIKVKSTLFPQEHERTVKIQEQRLV